MPGETGAGAASGLTCPSAQPDMQGAQVLGVHETGPETGPGGRRLAYVNARVPVSAEVTASTGEVPPTLVYRFAADCQEGACVHHESGKCTLVQRVVAAMEPVVAHRPACAIRPSCRWFAEEGEPACLRCPQVVTRIEEPGAEIAAIAGRGARF